MSCVFFKDYILKFIYPKITQDSSHEKENLQEIEKLSSNVFIVINFPS